MNPDFLDAHHRHWDDAETLYDNGNGRLANADHLYGMAAECGLKRLMMVFGMMIDAATGKPYKPNTNPREWETKHADKIRARYQSYLSGNQAINYALSPTDPFFDWDVNQRYANRSDFDNAKVQPHRDGAQEVRNLIEKAEIAGLI